MRPKSFALLLLALGCGLVASIGITRVMGTWSDKPEVAATGTEPIVVAHADVGLGDMLTPEQLKLENWPKGKIPQGAIAKIEDVDGRRTRARLYSGEPILESKLFDKGATQQGAAAMIPAGFRLVTVKVDLVSGGGSLILPGDHVDVMVHLIQNPTKGIYETVTQTILQNIKVFAVNDVLDVEKDGSKSIAAKTITLLVTPEEAAKVMLATEMGNVNLVMRSPEDKQRVDDAKARPGELLGTSARSNYDREKTRTPTVVKPLPAPDTLPTVESHKPQASWVMRIITPNEVGEVKFQKQAKTASKSFELWKTATTVTAENNPKDEPVLGSKSGAETGKTEQADPPPKPAVDDLAI